MTEDFIVEKYIYLDIHKSFEFVSEVIVLIINLKDVRCIGEYFKGIFVVTDDVILE